MRVRFVLLVLSLICIDFAVHAQERCATVPYTQALQEKSKIPSGDHSFEQWLQTKIAQRNQSLRSNQQQSSYKIPVVVHVVHNGEAIGTGMNVSNARILSQIDVLNKDFTRQNADAVNTPAEFLPVAGSLDIEFVLAKTSPQGLPTNGIVRVHGGRSTWPISEDETLKAISFWPSEDYLNIWVTNVSSPYLGYAQFPVSNLPGLEDYQDEIAATDGVVIDYTVFGVGAPDPQYNLGRTTTHEVGHFLGLRHIWGDTDGCSGSDFVSDTPNQADETYECPVLEHPIIDCDNAPKMFQNFMDYTDDECMNLFTQGQVNRMVTVLENSPRRESLLTSPGLLELSGLGEDLKIVAINGPSPVSCATSPNVDFTVANVGSPPITSFRVNCIINETETFTAEFTGLNILSGEEFNAAFAIELETGKNSIALEVHSPNNAADAVPGNNDSTINVIVNNNRDFIPLREQFDESTTQWTIVNPTEGMKWRSTSTNFSKSMYFNAFDNVQTDDQSWIVSPVLDFSNTTKASLFFDYSYSWNNSGDDRLMVLASTDCGETFLAPLFNSSGAALATADTESEWEPSQSGHWNTFFINLNSLAGEEDVRIAFVVTNKHGNNIFIDNIEFFTSDNQTPVDAGERPFAVYWNNSGGVDITFNLPERQNVELSVMDLMGREIRRASLSDMLNQTFAVPTGDISTGLYVIRLSIGEKYYSVKVYLSP